MSRGFDPHYAGRGRAYVTIERSYDYDTAPPTGGVFAWVGLGGPEETRAGFDLPGFARFYDMACDYDGNALVQPTAFTHGAEVFETVEDYVAYQKQQLARDDPELAFAVESFLPIGLLGEGEAPTAGDGAAIGDHFGGRARDEPGDGADLSRGAGQDGGDDGGRGGRRGAVDRRAAAGAGAGGVGVDERAAGRGPAKPGGSAGATITISRIGEAPSGGNGGSIKELRSDGPS